MEAWRTMDGVVVNTNHGTNLTRGGLLMEGRETVARRRAALARPARFEFAPFDSPTLVRAGWAALSYSRP